MDSFLETYDLPRLNNEEIENLTKLIVTKEILAIIKNFSTNKSLEHGDFTDDFYQTFKETLIPIILKSSKKRRGRNTPKLFCEASITLIPKGYQIRTLQGKKSAQDS